MLIALSFFPYKDVNNRSQMSKIVYKASCWDYQDFLHRKKQNVDYMTEKLSILKGSQVPQCHAPALADHVTSTSHNLKRDHFEILVNGRYDTHCKIKGTLLIQELKATLNDNVSSEKLYVYLC